MAQMADRYPDCFIGMAYHTEYYEQGGMVVMPDADFPVGVKGYPEGWINRSVKLDMVPEEVNELWSEAAKGVAPADLDVALDWADDAHTQLLAKVSARFAIEFEKSNFRLSLALMADGLKNPRWIQSNNYVGSDETGDYWDLFTKGKPAVKDLVFNEIVVSYKDTKGIEGSVPEIVTLDTMPELTETFTLDDIRNIKGENFLTPGCTLHAVGLLIDASTGAVLNSAKSPSVSPEISAVRMPDSDNEIVSTEWFTLQGIRIERPESEKMAIRIDHLSNGKMITTKTLAK